MYQKLGLKMIYNNNGKELNITRYQKHDTLNNGHGLLCDCAFTNKLLGKVTMPKWCGSYWNSV